MAYLAPAHGKHHRRPGTHARKRDPYLTTSDKWWVAVVAAVPFALLATKPLPHTAFWMVGVLGMAVAAVLRRLFHHPGDRRYSGINPTPQEHEEFRRVTGEIPVLEPTALTPAPVTVATVHRRPAWMPTKPQLVAFGVTAVLTILAAHSHQRMEEAQKMEADLDELLGIPGKWNGFQPTSQQPNMMEWGPSLAERQWMALNGYEQARFSEEGRRKWRQEHLW